MRKIRIIIGKESSGKSAIAKAMIGTFKKNEIGYINSKTLKSGFCFSHCSSETKVLVFDDVSEPKDINEIIMYGFTGIKVNKTYQEPLSINPFIIIVCNENILRNNFLNSGASIMRRIDFIETLN